MLDLLKNCCNWFLKSTAIFYFLLKHFEKLIKFIKQSYLFITSEFIFILKSIFCLPEKPR